MEKRLIELKALLLDNKKLLPLVHGIVIVLLISIFLLGVTDKQVNGRKITGITFVGPAKKMNANTIEPLLSTNARWVALNPYAMSVNGLKNLVFDHSYQWWGESSEGVITTIQYAHQYGLKVMLKPHVWVNHKHWTGDLSLPSDKVWGTWEDDYEQYILAMATIADSMNISLFCIGTEFKTAIKQRPEFWRHLIGKVRKVYSGKLTYAANWDNYQNIPFWEKLDYIGINAYFPLSDKDTPEIDELLNAWNIISAQIASFSKKYNKQVLFTEYGYRSINKAAGNQWDIKEPWETKQLGNMKVQINGFEALFQKFWNKEWFAGGFVWKWYDYHDKAGGNENTDYTPQNKPAEKIIQKWYGKKK